MFDLTNNRIKLLLFFFFILCLVFQNSLALILVNIFETNFVRIIFVIKESILFICFILMLLTVRSYRLGMCDFLGLLVMFYIFLRFSFGSADISTKLYSFRLYAVPIVLYFLGKMYFGNISFSKIRNMLLFVTIPFLILSVFFYFVDKKSLSAWNMGALFEAKGMALRGAGFLDAFPVNFFSFYGNNIYERLFGPLFDPLATAFFLVPFLFLFLTEMKFNKRYDAFFLFFSFFIVLLLTQTRAILGGIFLTILFISGAKYSKLESRIKLFVVMFLAGFSILLAFYNFLMPYADPSSRGHLVAYEVFLGSLSTASPMDIAFGQGLPRGLRFGSESIFISMIIHGGVLFCLLFLLFVFKGIFEVVKNKNCFQMKLIVIFSFVCYFVSSFTTEHWFAVSSSGMFWVLFGMSNTHLRMVEA